MAKEHDELIAILDTIPMDKATRDQAVVGARKMPPEKAAAMAKALRESRDKLKDSLSKLAQRLKEMDRNKN